MVKDSLGARKGRGIFGTPGICLWIVGLNILKHGVNIFCEHFASRKMSNEVPAIMSRIGQIR
jgi:hypothetical protein